MKGKTSPITNNLRHVAVCMNSGIELKSAILLSFEKSYEKRVFFYNPLFSVIEFGNDEDDFFLEISIRNELFRI